MIYNRLLELYKKNRASEKTPLEDFITEILVGVLENDNELLDSFVNNILEIEGTGFSIESQVKYNLDNDINCIIDIVVRNDENICFIENKVHSSEGERQLERYSKVLNEIHSFQGKNMFLRYCTKFYDPKNIDNIDFLQYRWSNVYRFLEEYKSELIYEYLEFLRGEGMAGSGDFNYEDLIVMKKINSTIAKMDECLDNVKDTLIKEFGKPYERDYERLKQIVKDEEYTMWTNGIIEGCKSYVSLGFTFLDEVNSSTMIPFLHVDLCVYLNNPKYNRVKEQMIELEKSFNQNYSDDNKILLSYEKPLVDFISLENQMDSITGWFRDRIIDVKGIVNNIIEQ